MGPGLSAGGLRVARSERVLEQKFIIYSSYDIDPSHLRSLRIPHDHFLQVPLCAIVALIVNVLAGLPCVDSIF